MQSSLKKVLQNQDDLVHGVENMVLARVVSELSAFDQAFKGYKWPIQQSTVATLLYALKLKDRTTFSHSLRCGVYAHMLAKETEAKELGYWTLLALIHDVGKISVPDDILSDPNELPLRAFERVKQHTIEGQALLTYAGAPEEFRQAIRHHHERMDGYGYPEGLSGDNIPLASRMILVIDSFDALTSNRPYRSGLSYEDAFEEMRKSAGSQLDKRLTRLFLNGLKPPIAQVEKKFGLESLPRIA